MPNGPRSRLRSSRYASRWLRHFNRYRKEPVMFSLEFPQSEMVARVIWSATHAAWDLCLAGPTWPKKDERFERMKNPQPGDLVIEVGGGLREADCANAVGWLVREAREPVFTAEEWDGGDEPIPTERVFYIKTISGNDCRWVNCSFLTVPDEGGWWTYERQKARDPLAQAMSAGTAKTPKAVEGDSPPARSEGCAHD